MKTWKVYFALLVVGLSACGEIEASGKDGTTQQQSVGGPAEAVTVGEALKAPVGQTLRVRGGIVHRSGGPTWICDEIAESDPVRCVDGAVVSKFDVGLLDTEPSPVHSDGERIEIIVVRTSTGFEYVSGPKT